MMRFIKWLACSLCIAVAGGVLSGCGGGTEVPEGMVVGTLYVEDGQTAPKVKVRIGKSGPSSSFLAKSRATIQEASPELLAETDRQGNIVIEKDALQDGWYYLCGETETGDLKSYIDSVFISDGECSRIRDTLRETGSLTGKIELHYLTDPRKTLIWISSSTSLLISDAGGNFSLTNFAEGTYDILFIPINDQYDILDTVVTIEAGCNDTLPRALKLPYVQPVTGFSCTMDTLMRSVTFFWDRLDEQKISGYQFSTNEGGDRSFAQVLFKDTSITIYLKDSVGARVRALDLNSDPMGDYTPRMDVKAHDLFTVRTIVKADETVTTKGWAVSDGRINVLQVSQYNPKDVHIDVFDTSGVFIMADTLDTRAGTPLAVALQHDTLFLLDKKSDDTLCVRRADTGDTLSCDMNVKVPNNFGIGSNLKFGSDGMIYISQYLTLYIVGNDGVLKKKMNGVSPHFAHTETGLYTFIQGLHSRLVKYDDELNPLDIFSYDKYGHYTDTDVLSKFAAANNNGLLCCMFDLSLFVFDEKKSFEARVYIEQGVAVIDIMLTDNNILYLLYSNGRIDAVDLGGLSSRLK